MATGVKGLNERVPSTLYPPHHVRLVVGNNFLVKMIPNDTRMITQFLTDVPRVIDVINVKKIIINVKKRVYLEKYSKRL